MKVITFLLETQQPILATSFQGDPNSDVSFPYIPGSMIRGALIGRYLKRHPELPEDILSDADINKEAKRLFFDGNTRYLNAYIFCEKQTKRTLPVPLAWYKEKGDELPTPEEIGSLDIYDLSQYEPEQVSLKGLSEKFCTVNERQVVLYREKRRINIHTARDRTKGRSSPTKIDPSTNQVIQEGEGTIFRYEALDVKQTFQGVILCEDDDAQTIESLLNPADIWLGGSRSAGYGHIKIQILSSDKPQELDNWNEIQIKKPEDRLNRKKLKITLLSDAIFRDCCGQFSAEPCLVKQAIEDKLQVQLPQATNVFISSTIVGGFNQKWGLPLPQVPALSAGSVFVFDLQLTTEQIKILEREGIGERCIDGFGRVAVNWLGEYREFSATPPEPVTAKETHLEEKYHDLAGQMAENILHQKLEQFLVKTVSEINIQGNITNSQLSRLEIVARQGLTNPPSFLSLIELLSSLTSNAKEQYRNTKVSGNKSLEQQLNDWLVKPIGNTDSWLKNPQELEVSIAGITRKIEPNSDLATEYTLRFIMAIAKKAKKEKNK
ncbi:MAG: CRISPR-associated protein Csx10 [Planktothrix agardhii KL2]|jgi:CRISPR-associated protein Csx10|uniref:RAMP superfamily CRISPR-associated protein n=1 Tax=Planktothrix agardhii TaxID=1160 RepID=UPI001A2BCBE2|nr:RAMP superfamily CRISPR-associated protein [Planktothrix agardhii]MBG0747899.1 CRISPR-associated protein Csx10 [Planktothrix agardhii KL2]MCF3583353.1 RAMP superfamily CRISPR-associated protein [Planktothrix agardhii 1811]